MAQTRGSLSQLHDNTDRKVFVMLNQQLKKLPAGWREVFKVENSERQTEIELITGSLVREAERRDVPVPLHQLLYALVRGREASWQVTQEPTGGQR